MQKWGTVEVAQSVKCLRCKYADLSSVLRTHIRMLGIELCIVAPGLGK